jgi:hypothetical protein
LKRFWNRQDELERRLSNRPAPPPRLVNTVLRQIGRATPARQRSSFRLGLAAAVSVGMLVALAALGGLGYAASSVQHAVRAAVQVVGPSTPQRADQPQLNSAAAQYGNKVTVCAVTPNGNQHTISISQNAVASYLAHHPQAYLGSCAAFRPRGAKPNVCLRLADGSFVAIWVRPSLVQAYLQRNYLSHRTATGRC